MKVPCFTVTRPGSLEETPTKALSHAIQLSASSKNSSEVIKESEEISLIGRENVYPFTGYLLHLSSLRWHSNATSVS